MTHFLTEGATVCGAGAAEGAFTEIVEQVDCVTCLHMLIADHERLRAAAEGEARYHREYTHMFNARLHVVQMAQYERERSQYERERLAVAAANKRKKRSG